MVSGHFGRKEVVHFQAPCEQRACVEVYMDEFIDWFNQDESMVDYPVYDYLKAAMAKFWFVTIHPFDDGIARRKYKNLVGTSVYPMRIRLLLCLILFQRVS